MKVITISNLIEPSKSSLRFLKPCECLYLNLLYVKCD